MAASMIAEQTNERTGIKNIWIFYSGSLVPEVLQLN
jgi:hypothetical protein